MKRCVVALIASGVLSLAMPVAAQDGYPAHVYVQPAPQPMYRTFGRPLPYRVYQPSYRPYAHGGRQGVGYVWGFPWVYGGY